MANRYLGYGVTNSQGIATLDHDADGNPITHSYTGVGAGEVDIFAISSGVRSDVKSFLDCIIYLTNTFPNTSVYYSAGINKAAGTGGNSVVFTINSGSSYGIISFKKDNEYYTNNHAFECKIIAYSGTVSLRFDTTATHSKPLNASDFNFQNGDTLRVEDNGTIISFYKNGEKLSYDYPSDQQIRFGFRIEEGGSLELTNMKVYPI